MLDPHIIAPLVQTGLPCLQNAPDFITVEYQNGNYIFQFRHSNFPWMTTIGIILVIIFISISIFHFSLPVLIPGICFSCAWLSASISTEILPQNKRLILTADQTVKVMVIKNKKEIIYEIPKGTPIQFASRVTIQTKSKKTVLSETLEYTIYNTCRLGIISPCQICCNDHWLETLFNEINASWYGVQPCNASSNAPVLSSPAAPSAPYDRRKYEHATLDISGVAQEITPVLRNIPSFDDDRYIPVPSEHTALSGRYHNLTKIGGGAQGAMFRALDQNNQPVGIKVYNFLNFQSWKDAELFEREVETLQSLHFKGIPKYIELIDNNPLYYLVESYIPAPSMAKRIKNGERIDFENALLLLTNIAEVLNYLETLTPPVIHRDIKPDNLLIDDEYNVWLVDFGVVAASDQKTNASTFAGTAGYMAPEQLTGKVTPAADIYSAGISILAYLTGKDPTCMKMNGLSIDVRAELPEHIPAWFKQLLLDMTEPSPEKRLSKAASIAAIIQDCIAHSYSNDNDHDYSNFYHNQNHLDL